MYYNVDNKSSRAGSKRRMQESDSSDDESEDMDGFHNFMDPGYTVDLNFGPPYGHPQPEVIGCGVDYATNTVFFTKEGQLVGSKKFRRALPTPLYAAVGVHEEGGTVVVLKNTAFLFDIDSYVLKQLSWSRRCPPAASGGVSEK
mmetsp:Transcript_5742/g.11372  ORF Transcript_5742/g.11372 Transcript_5742/m.11372 type:complete len:144 (-) Transcript_5742:170-601(-)